jgi:hypothetical protein
LGRFRFHCDFVTGEAANSRKICRKISPVMMFRKCQIWKWHDLTLSVGPLFFSLGLWKYRTDFKNIAKQPIIATIRKDDDDYDEY